MSLPVRSPDRLPWLVGAVVLVAQLVMIRDVAGPVVYADELGYIAAARYFAPGGSDIQMLSAFYHFGYGLLLSPLAALIDEPGSFYRAATIFNAALATVATMIFHRVALVGQLSVEPRLAALSALGFGMAPSVLVNTSIVWAETVLVLTITITAVALPWLFARPTASRAVVCGLVSTTSYAVHPRAIVMVLAAGIVLVIGGSLRVLPWLVVGAGLGAEVAALLGARVVNETLRAAIYTNGSFQQTAGGIGEAIIGSPGQWLAGLAGTFWYQLLGSAGLAGFGVLFAARTVLDTSALKSDSRSLGRFSPALTFLLLSLGGSWLVGAVISVAETPRIDHFFYGRYLDVFAPFLIAFGVLELARRQRVLSTVAALVVLLGGGWALGFRGDANFFSSAQVVRVNVPVANALERVTESWNPLALAMVGGAWCAAVLIAGRWRTFLSVAAFALGSLLIAEVTLSQTIRPASHAGEARAGLAGPAESVADGGTVFLAAPYEFWTLNGLQFWADDVQFALETQCATVATDVVIAAVDDPRMATWTLVSVDEELGRGLFEGNPGPWSGSRSVEITVVDVSVVDGLVTAVLDVANLDQARPLSIGEVLVLFARWSVAGENVEDSPIELLGVIGIEPGADGRQLFEFEAPGAVRGQAVDLAFDVRDPKRGWLSDCEQSRLDTVPVVVD